MYNKRQTKNNLIRNKENSLTGLTVYLDKGISGNKGKCLKLRKGRVNFSFRKNLSYIVQ